MRVRLLLWCASAMPRVVWAAREPHGHTGREAGHGCVEGGEHITSWPGTAVWDGVCAASVADDTWAPRGT